MLRNALLEHGNLVKYAEKHKMEQIEAGSSSSSVPQFQSGPSSSASRKGPSNWRKILQNSRLVLFSLKSLLINFGWAVLVPLPIQTTFFFFVGN